jgi:hypothetical protein
MIPTLPAADDAAAVKRYKLSIVEDKDADSWTRSLDENARTARHRHAAFGTVPGVRMVKMPTATKMAVYEFALTARIGVAASRP